MDDAMLMVAARRAYERGRLTAGARRAAGVAPLAALPLYRCLDVGSGAPQVLVGLLALVTLVTLFSWRGEGYARGVRPGLVAGLGPLLLPLLAHATGVMCSATLCGILPAAAAAGGFLGGLWLGGQALARERHDAPYWFAAAAVSASLGALGCLHVGLAGLGAMALGLLAGSAPALVAAVIRSR
jgi:hypothetical protein